eukprot:PITA_02470
MHEGQVVYYESRKVNEDEQKYVTHDIELASIIHAMKMWRHYLIGMRFILMSDDNGLRYLFEQPNLNSRKARWLAMLSEFDFDIRDGWEMQAIKKNLKEIQDRHKSYAYQHRVFKEFQVGEHVYLCIDPKKISLRIESCVRMTPRYCWPFEILERIGLVACRLELPLKVKVHDVFHVSLLKKYVKYVDHVIDWFVLQVELEGEFYSQPQCILQRKILLL